MSQTIHKDDIFCITEALSLGPKVQTITMNELIYAGSINALYSDFGNDVLKTMSFPKLQQLGDTSRYMNWATNVWNCSILIRNANTLETLILPMLNIMSGAIFLEHLNAITTIQINGPKSINGIHFAVLPALTKMEFSNLEEIGFYFVADNLKSITSYAFPALRSVPGVSTGGNDNLVSINFNNASVGNIQVVNNPLLTCENICSLKNYTGTAKVTNNKEASCDLKNICK